MQGRRREDVIQEPDGHYGFPEDMAPGDYWKTVHLNGNEEWYGCTPSGWIGSLRAHTIVEHEDGTISVTPSILVHEGAAERRQWHGYLTNGQWSEV